MSGHWFITGTDTGCGKTTVTAALARRLAAGGRRVACFKPVASGCRQTPEGLRNEDAEQLMAAAGVGLPYDTVNPCALEPAIAPHVAAERAGVAIDLDRIRHCIADTPADIRLIEGAGGWRVPLDGERFFCEIPRMLDAGVIVVVGMRLGCINHALLTAAAIAADGLRLDGWVANFLDAEMSESQASLETIRHHLPAPLLATAAWAADANEVRLAHWNPLEEWL